MVPGGTLFPGAHFKQLFSILYCHGQWIDYPPYPVWLSIPLLLLPASHKKFREFQLLYTNSRHTLKSPKKIIRVRFTDWYFQKRWNYHRSKSIQTHLPKCSFIRLVHGCYMCTPCPFPQQWKMSHPSVWECCRQTALTGGTASGVPMTDESYFPDDHNPFPG